MLKILTSDYAYQILSHVRQTSTSIDILSYVIKFNLYKRSDKANLIFSALKSLPFPHTSVRFILDKPRSHKPNYHCNKFSARRLKEAGFLVRHQASGDTQHAKLFLFDKSIAITGSHNITTTSVISRYDISILIDSPPHISYLVDLFNQLWDNSREA